MATLRDIARPVQTLRRTAALPYIEADGRYAGDSALIESTLPLRHDAGCIVATAPAPVFGAREAGNDSLAHPLTMAPTSSIAQRWPQAMAVLVITLTACAATTLAWVADALADPPQRAVASADPACRSLPPASNCPNERAPQR